MTAWGSAATPPPGWYPDPGQPASLRWWDGVQWTQHQAPGWQPPMAAVPGPGMPGPNHDLDWVLPVNRDGFAIAAGYLALFSLLPNPLTSAAAVVCGGVALRRIATSRKLGRGRAWFGIIVGSLSFGLFALAMLTAH